MTTPNKKLVEILRPVYRPCPGFKAGCAGVARWAPAQGHVPRGFVGAPGPLNEVKVVILLAEPGDPHAVESYQSRNQLEQTCKYTFRVLSEGTDPFHRNLKYVLNRLFPGLFLQDQLRKAWITETYLCSAPQETGPVPRVAENECVSRYLAHQLKLFAGLPVIALGGKAYERAKRVPGVRNLKKAFSVGPPGSNQRKAKPSWNDAAEWARAMF